MLIKASGVKLLICGGTAQTVHTHLHTGMIAHNNTSVYRQVTLKINLHGCIYKEPQCSFKWNKCALLIQSSSSSSSDAQTHVNMALNCRSGGSIQLMQTQRPAVYTPTHCKKQLQSINIMLQMGHAHTRMHSWDWSSSCSEAEGQTVPNSCGFLQTLGQQWGRGKGGAQQELSPIQMKAIAIAKWP